MPLTTKDICLFAKSATEFHSDVYGARTPDRKARYLHQHRLVAGAYYDQAIADVIDSGYRATRRVRDVIWAELERIAIAEKMMHGPGF